MLRQGFFLTNHGGDEDFEKIWGKLCPFIMSRREECQLPWATFQGQ